MDHLPLIPKTRVKLGADYALMPTWSIGASLVVVGDSFYKGDESNQNPQLPGYTVVGLRSSCSSLPQIQLFANVQNLLDRRYSTFGLYSDPTGVGAPGIPANADSNDPGVDNRFGKSGHAARLFRGDHRSSFDRRRRLLLSPDAIFRLSGLLPGVAP